MLTCCWLLQVLAFIIAPGEVFVSLRRLWRIERFVANESLLIVLSHLQLFERRDVRRVQLVEIVKLVALRALLYAAHLFGVAVRAGAGLVVVAVVGSLAQVSAVVRLTESIVCVVVLSGVPVL